MLYFAKYQCMKEFTDIERINDDNILHIIRYITLILLGDGSAGYE